MGWTLDTGDAAAYRHEGWAAAVRDEGLDTLDEPANTADTVIGWLAACECGWMSPHLVSRADYPSLNGRLDEDSIGEQIVIADWEAHVRPVLVLAAVTTAEAARSTASLTLDHAVHDARRYGISWQSIGDAVGISRQSAHERWAHLDQLSV